ncbi:MAG TPA: hypothetical protein VL688_11325 [Verrucomicrobiae bacterium]|jgi:hypothetical protein|nr:hypothetical protein [Verrucomicrobiae bacterium]
MKKMLWGAIFLAVISGLPVPAQAQLSECVMMCNGKKKQALESCPKIPAKAYAACLGRVSRDENDCKEACLAKQ